MTATASWVGGLAAYVSRPEPPPPVMITFDLSDPAGRHVLTQALEDYAGRQEDMAASGDAPEQRLTWAAHAKAMRDKAAGA